ncbi:hypothetical protein GCM10023081_00290 [Arthrobacter ginkgonis]|uniref:Uncharacterized protein n=1 Tax=Arthrobacter ginkgonis TaxID=1630594 RepID=A0ABP7BQP2_9MICC
MRVRMELYAKIRRDARVEGVSIRGPAKRYQIGRDTVRQALSDPVPLAPGETTNAFESPRGPPRYPPPGRVHTTSEIAELFGVARSIAYRAIKRGTTASPK